MKYEKIIREVFFSLLLFLSSINDVNSQTFKIIDSLKINNSEFVNGWFEQMNSNDIIAYYWVPAITNKDDSIKFFIYNYKKEKILWFSLPLPFTPDNNDFIINASIFDDKLVLLGPNYFYLYNRLNKNFSFIKKIKLKHKRNIFFDKIYLNDNKIILFSTYDYSNSSTVWSKYNYTCFDLNKNKYTFYDTINIGRAINMCYYPIQPISVNNKYIVISSITKPIITVLPINNLRQKKYIKIPNYKINTDSIFNIYLNDSILKEYRFNPKNKIYLINKYKLYKEPMISKISLINDDSLICIVNIDTNNFNKKRILYIFSLKNGNLLKSAYINKYNYNNPRNFFFTSGTIIFNNEKTTTFLTTKANNKTHKMDYYLITYKYIDSNKQNKIDSVYENNTDTNIVINNIDVLFNVLYDYKKEKIEKNNINKFLYFLLPDDYFCASCNKSDKNEKILIMIKDKGDNETYRLIKKQYYTLLFPNSSVYFYSKKYQVSKKMKINIISKIKR